MKLPQRIPPIRRRTPQRDDSTIYPYARLSSNERQQLGVFLQPDEHIKAAIRGHQPAGGEAMVAATDKRILLLHDTPLYSNLEIISYDLIHGVSVRRGVQLVSSICLYTAIKQYQFDYVNTRAAQRIMKYIETRIYTPLGSHMHMEGGMTAMG